jgi:hypothetical protein
MDPRDQHALIVVLVAGTIIVAIGTTTLYLIFRAYGGAKAGGTAHKILIAALIVFLFLCCMGLLAFSYVDR